MRFMHVLANSTIGMLEFLVLMVIGESITPLWQEERLFTVGGSFSKYVGVQGLPNR